MRRKVTRRDPASGRWIEEWVDEGAGRGRSGDLRSNTGAPGLASRVRDTKRATLPRGQYVYFVQAGDDHGLIKIGCTGKLAKRFAELSHSNATPLRLLGYVEGYKYTEGLLHGIFAADRVHGEWFRCSERLLALAAGELVLTINGDLKPPKLKAS